jgi:hypothetical protein
MLRPSSELTGWLTVGSVAIMLRLSSPHPAPFALRLLQRPLPLTPFATPPDGGVAAPRVVVTPSPSAAVSLAAAVAANPGIKELPNLPHRILDQQTTECCVSCALQGAMESLERAGPDLSPMFHYHVTRRRPAGADQQGRLFLDEGVSTLEMDGICREADHRSVFDAAGIAAPVSAAAIQNASTRRIATSGFAPKRYIELTGTALSTTVRDHISLRHPVVVMIRLPLGYPDPLKFLNSDHEWLDPNATQPSISRHCVLIVGFDDTRGSAASKGAVKVVDSRGKSSFKHGMWWMGYRVLNSQFALQAFALT